MAWIESHQQLENHPKVFNLLYAMSWDLDQTIGKLHRFWWWCVDYAEDGDLRKFSDTQIGHAVGLNGDQAKSFVKAMLEAGWLDREPFFRVHDWWDYIGLFLQIKYKSRKEKWSKVRDSYYTEHNNGLNNRSNNSIPNLTKPNLTKHKGAFKKPGLEDVKAAFKSRGFSELNAEAFIDHHEARGWILSNGKPMKSLNGAVGTWIRNGKLFGTLIAEGGKNDGWDRPFPV